MTTAGITVVVIGCWVAAMVKLRSARQRHDPAQRSLGLSLAAIGAGVVLFEPGLYRALDRCAGVANLSALLGQVLVLVAALHARVFLLRLTGTPSRSWLRWCALALTATAMTASFLLAPVAEYAPVVFSAAYAKAPGVAAYWAAFLAYLVFTLSAVARLSLRYAAMSAQRLMRRGLVLVAAGTSLGIVYFLYWGVRLMILRSGHPVPAAVDVALRQMMAASNALILLGVALPAWGEQLATRKAYWQLYPLWVDVARAVPGIVLEPPATPLTARVAVRHASQRLYRRVIEIQDGRLTVRDQLDSTAARRARNTAAAAGLRDADAAAEAALLRSALHADRPHLGAAAGGEPNGSNPIGSSPDGDEVQWLVRVARAYRQLPTAGSSRTPRQTDRQADSAAAA